MTQLTYQLFSASRINDRGLEKPNEDYFMVDRERNFFMLLDGITRVHQEYADAPGHSAACDVNQIFSEAAFAYFAENAGSADPNTLLRSAALAGNAALLYYRQQKPQEQWQFFPGTLGILAMLQKNRLYYAYTGDCMCTLLRQDSKLHFCQQGANQALEQLKVSKADRYEIYCNHPEHPLSYGIFNGDENVNQLLEQGSLELQRGDVLFLSTDGLSSYMRFTKADTLRNQTPEEILDASGIYDKPPFAAYADDKTLLKLVF